MSVNNGPNITTDGLVLNVDAADIKSYPGDDQYSTHCDIAIVKLYDRAITQAEARQSFNALRGRFGI